MRFGRAGFETGATERSTRPRSNIYSNNMLFQLLPNTEIIPYPPFYKKTGAVEDLHSPTVPLSRTCACLGLTAAPERHLQDRPLR